MRFLDPLGHLSLLGRDDGGFSAVSRIAAANPRSTAWSAKRRACCAYSCSAGVTASGATCWRSRGAVCRLRSRKASTRPERAKVLAIIRPVAGGDHRDQSRESQHSQYEPERNLLFAAFQRGSPARGEIVVRRAISVKMKQDRVEPEQVQDSKLTGPEAAGYCR